MLVNKTLTSTALLIAIFTICICLLQPVQKANAWQSWSYNNGQPPWYGPHPDIANFAVSKTSFVDNNYLQTLRTGSAEPDLWGQLPPDHAYFWDGTPNTYWNAAWHAQDAAYRARTAYVQNDKSTAYDELGHAMHYMADLSMPYHTTATQGIVYHTAYEKYAGIDDSGNNNWDSGKNFKSSVGNANPSPRSVTNTDQIYRLGRDLAYASYTWASPITLKIITEPNYWYNDPEVTSWTTTTYTNGLSACESLSNYVKRGY